MDPALAKASSLAQSGRFDEAAERYRGILRRRPDDAEATHFLGVCLVRSGRPSEGLALLERSVTLAPGNAMYRQNFGLILAEAGQLAAAEAQFRSVLAAEPGNASAHNFLGMACQRLGRLDEALAAYESALRLAPGDPAAANNLGYCLLERGEAEAAEAWLRRALAAAPDNAMAHNNLGNALRLRGDVQAAVQSYRRALALAPAFSDAYYNLAMALRDLGERLEALGAARRAVQTAPPRSPAWQLFAELLAVTRFTAWDEAMAADCQRLFAHAEVEVQICAEALLSLVRHAPRGALFRLLLEHALVADEDFEREMTAWRREQLLERPESLELVCALAQQCFLNEYLWEESEAETAALEGLSSRAATALELATLAMYRPLRGHAKPREGGDAFERLWRRVVEEPAAEARLDIPALTPVRDAVSRAVRAQYEENPYPRWHRAPAPGAFPLRRMLRQLFPHLDVRTLPEAPEILIAGCGTGRHAAISAQLHPRARILAVDISRASLAYAQRRAHELGLANVRFAQADLLELGALAERFDLVECAGVLHHLADPLAGWRVLVGLLRPGGLMKVALYSELGRRRITQARRLVAGLEVRAARRRLFELPAADPAREVTRLRDFYSASGARDLVLHVQEHRFTPEELARMLDALGLEFLGFEFTDNTLQAYRRRFPEDPKGLSFDRWGEFEREHPDTFASMYQFWVRR
ncbi:MAG TPA: tetratricopeptide repeat protein [Burkholderiales bacterium]|nr:tetratricopeptide repeat protein [Burkholderiales bacterium]